MSPEYLGVIMLGLLLAMVIGGVHLSFSLMFLAVIFGFLYRGPAILSLFMQSIFGTMQNEILIAVPLFTLMGCILEKSGAAERLFDATYHLLGPLRGGLALTTIIISTIFAACTGVIAASVSMMALVALPAMLKRGYAYDLATGVVCAGGTLGILIPPSVMLVLMGPMANLSVADLFAGAFMPGLLLSVLYIIYIIIRSWIDPESAPAIKREEKKSSLGELVSHLVFNLLPVVVLLVAVLGSILLGVCSPTEASALGVTGASLIALAYRNFNVKMLRGALYETLKVTSMVFFVIMGAAMFTSVFMFMRGGNLIKEIILGLGFGKGWIIFIMMFILFVLGMFLDWIGILYITLPIFVPIAVSLGFDPLFFVLLVAVNLQLSFLSPPFAYAIFFVKGVCPPEVTTKDIYKGVVPFLCVQAIGLALCYFFPQILMWLPSRF